MAQATMAAIPGLREDTCKLKTRMDKAVEDFRKAMALPRAPGWRVGCTPGRRDVLSTTVRRCR